MLFVSYSYGLVFSLENVFNKTGQSNDPGLILLDNTTSGFKGIDDTFDGSITFNFTIAYDIYPSGGAFSVFHLETNAGITPIAIGNNWESGNWGGYRIDGNGTTNLVIGSTPVVEGQSQAFTMTIDYNAGALDTGTLIIDGDPSIWGIPRLDYSFDMIKFRNGLDNTVSSMTNISVSVVPEPASYALIFGSLALVFVALRRRFKA